MNADWVLLARVRRPRGVRGEVNAENVGSQPSRFKAGLVVHLVSSEKVRSATIENAWFHNGELVLKFAGLDTRDDAETLRGLEVCIKLEERPPAPEGEYYYSDLVGCKVETETGRVLGEVKAWHDYGASPILEIRNGDLEILVPFTAAYYRSVDLTTRRIVMELPDGIEDVNAR
ncbi:MAG: 16S rRNA processing protein RimM [Bryobacteraceae bacterium]|nr:16S rRNA processing protein RimM [Bryobacteraceae bacterium]